MGVTATGLILMRVVDPQAESPAFEAFGYKQLVFEPFFGGGLITAMAVPIIFLTGVWPLFFVMLAVFLVAVLSGLFYFRPREMRDRAEWRRRSPAPRNPRANSPSTRQPRGRNPAITPTSDTRIKETPLPDRPQEDPCGRSRGASCPMVRRPRF